MRPGNESAQTSAKSLGAKKTILAGLQPHCTANAALELAREGFAVFPCRTNKKPHTLDGFKSATTDPDQITQWWQDHSDALVGVPTGSTTGLLVVDIDPDGATWYAENFARLKAGRIHQTQRGHHLLYRMPATEIRCSAGKIAPGVDVRAEGGYVIWWPADGFETVGDMVDVNDVPAWLLDLLTTSNTTITSNAIIEGGRNSHLTSLAGSMRRRGMNSDAMTAALMVMNSTQCKPPLPDAEVLQIVQHVAKYAPAEDALPVSLDDFRAHMPSHKYIFTPTRDLWPGASVNARVPWPPVLGKDGQPKMDKNGEPVLMPPSNWLDKNAAVEQMTWAPGMDMLIENKLIDTGGWIDYIGCTCFNLYRPPTLVHGDPTQVGPWIAHIKRIYPDDCGHIIKWFAHRVQYPADKLNHALVLGGPQGIGKDTILEPVKYAVGPWNFNEVAPGALMGRFNGFVKSVVLRVSEARDLGDTDRFKFYDHSKALIAAPPDVIRCDEKNLREHPVPNVCGVIITTNHKSDGLYLPADDRRHYVAWSDSDKNQFEADYWNRLWQWYYRGGIGHVAAYLASVDLAGFDPKAPPLKTAAFWHIVDASRAPEESELADILDSLQSPEAVTLDLIVSRARLDYPDFATWLTDRRNRRQIPHRLESAGYEPVRNQDAKDGLWVIRKRRQVIYAKTAFSIRDQHAAAQRLNQ